MHEHIAEEPPDLCAVSRMIHQRTLHEIWLVGLQHPFIEHHAVTHKHYDLKQTDTDTLNSVKPVKPDVSNKIRKISCLEMKQFTEPLDKT